MRYSEANIHPWKNNHNFTLSYQTKTMYFMGSYKGRCPKRDVAELTHSCVGLTEPTSAGWECSRVWEMAAMEQ